MSGERSGKKTGGHMNKGDTLKVRRTYRQSWRDDGAHQTSLLWVPRGRWAGWRGSRLGSRRRVPKRPSAGCGAPGPGRPHWGAASPGQKTQDKSYFCPNCAFRRFFFVKLGFKLIVTVPNSTFNCPRLNTTVPN